MRRVVLSSVLMVTLLTAVAAGSNQVGASTSSSSAQLTYTPSHETLQNIGIVNLAAAASAAASSLKSGTSAGGSTTKSSHHTMPVDTVLRPTINSAGSATVTSGATASVDTRSTANLPGFEGVSGPQQAAVNGGGDLEPPDQGTCAGPDSQGNPVVVDIINNALAAYSPTGGSMLGVTPTYALFDQPSTAFMSDPRCAYDATTKTWFFTEFVVGSSSAKPRGKFTPSTQYVAVSTSADPFGDYHVYGIDTTDLSNTVGDCPCFGDFDQVGFDANGIYITTNEFSTGGTSPYFNGTVLYAISKQGLADAAALGATLPQVARYAITGDAFGSSGGSQPYHVAPATTPSGGRYASNTEYFVESNSSAASDNHLIVYALTGTSALANNGIPPLQATDIASEAYSFPPNGAQPAGPLPLGNVIGTELGAPFFNTNTPQSLQTDFNAVQGVTFTNGALYAELDTASGAGTSAAAWFHITPSLSGSNLSAQIASQGYVATGHQNFMYPEIVVGPSGSGYMAFSMTGSAEYPSAAYIKFDASTGPNGPVVVEAGGNAPEDGFTCYITGYGGCRWGDYSGGAVWNGQAYMMTEYIPPSSQRDHYTNWGTYVWSGPAS